VSPPPPEQGKATRRPPTPPLEGQTGAATSPPDPGPVPGPGPGTPGSPAAPGPHDDRSATPKQERKTRPRVNRHQIREYTKDRARISGDGVVYAYCNINTNGTFTGRDSLGAATSDLFRAIVRPDHLKKLAHVYQEPDCAAAAAAQLTSGGLVCLSGTEGTGRMTLAIQLLRGRVKDEVYQIRPNTPVTELAEASFTRDCGYFLCVGPAQDITEFELGRLRSICEKGGLYLVLICTAERARILQDAAVIRVAPPRTDPAALLRTHIFWNLEPEVSPAAEALLTGKEVLDWCSSSHRLAEVDTVAGILADVARGRIERSALDTHLKLAGRDGMRNWFSNEKESLRPLIITLSFFGGLPLQTVLELEDRLHVHLREAAGEKAVRDLFATSDRTRLSEVSAHIGFAEHEDNYGAALAEIVEFADRTWENSLASLLQTEYPSVRPVLVDWLHELARFPDPHVQARAAMALGGFARDSFPSLIHEVIEPWAMQADEQAFLNVVWALTVPLATSDTAPRVMRLLEQWAVSDIPEFVCCAATVYGVALAPSDGALSGLARIARRAGQDEDWLAAAAAGVLAMYLGEFSDDVLSAIRRWSVSKKKTERVLALLTFVLIATWVETTIDAASSPYADPGTAPRSGKQDWPSLLLDACHADTHTDVVATAREALNQRDFSAEMLAALRRWFNRANDRPYLVEPLTNLMAALATTPAEAERLAYHLRAWAEKKPKGAAARVRKALLNPSARRDADGPRAGHTGAAAKPRLPLPDVTLQHGQ
jgi:hypothetical protein